MSQELMTLAERIRKISTAAAKMAEHRLAADQATTFDVADQHWVDYEDEVSTIFGLTATEEGQAALKQLEEIAVICADFEAHGVSLGPLKASEKAQRFVPAYDHPGDVA